MTVNPKVLHFFSSLSLYLGLASGLPYYLGDISNFLGPDAKKYITLTTLSVAAATKFTAFAIDFLQARAAGKAATLPAMPTTPTL